MSTERIVNRVQQTEFQKIEEAKLEDVSAVVDTVLANPNITNEDLSGLAKVGPAPVFKTEYQVPPHVGETVVLQPHQKATYAIKQIEDPADTIGNTVDPGVAGLLTSLIVSRVEFEKFRTQVIMVLKHQGVDVRKYFPE